MDNTENFNYSAGNYEMSIGDTLIPSVLLGDLVPNYEEGEITTQSQAGTIVTPNGKPDTAQFQFTMFLPAQNAVTYLGKIWPELYTAATGGNGGQIWFGSGTCKTRTPVPINIHNKCETTDDNDVFIPAALAKIAFNPTFSASEVAQVTITVYMQADANGNRMRFGTGDLTQESIYDVTTQKTVPVTSE